MTGPEPDEPLLTIDELAARTGVTVRTTRYYASRGLLPPPVRRGRIAYYSPAHRARLELLRALQEHGFTLAAVERYLARLPLDATPEDLAVQRAMLTSWAPRERELLTRRQLDQAAGRRLSADALEQLLLTGAVRRRGERGYELLPAFDVGVALLDLDLPLQGLVEASRAVQDHMGALADDLAVILRERLLAPYRRGPRSESEAARLEQTVSRLRQLTLEAVVRGFQHAADEAISRTLDRAAPPLRSDSPGVTVATTPRAAAGGAA